MTTRTGLIGHRVVASPIAPPMAAHPQAGHLPKSQAAKFRGGLPLAANAHSGAATHVAAATAPARLS